LLQAIGLVAVFAGAAAAQPGAGRPESGAVTYHITGARVAVAQNVQVAANEEVTDGIAVLGGSLRVDGRVRDDILVVGGDVHLGTTADVEGDVLLVGGTFVRDQGARLAGRVSSVSLGEWSRGTGLFSWRPRVDVGAFSGRVSVLAVLMALVLLMARTPVARVGRAAAAEPVRAVVVGLAVEVLFVPVLLVASISLGLTIVGLPLVFLLVPLAVLVATVALLLGYTALACRIGEWFEDRVGWRARSAFLATAIGLLIIIAPTLLARGLGLTPGPLRFVAFSVLVAGATVEFLVWTMGLGATLLTGFGRWNTAPPPLDTRA
jgi:hypothetical protein